MISRESPQAAATGGPRQLGRDHLDVVNLRVPPSRRTGSIAEHFGALAELRDVDRTGIQWRRLPHDFPHWNTVYGYFAKWQRDGVFAHLNGLLRRLLREKEMRDETSSRRPA